MKIEYLEIKNYKQFRDLTLELTYPKGHEKEGQPLDKICIIGQSGTGKTNLLEIIKKSVIDFSKQPENSYLPFTEFIGSKTKALDEYIANKFITKNDIKIKTIFTPKKSRITSNIEIKTSFDEKNYFFGTEKTTSLKNNSTKRDMSPSDKILLEEFFAYRNRLLEQGMEYHGINSFPRMLEKVDTDIKKLKKKYYQEETISNSINHLKFQGFIDKNIVNIHEEDNSWELLKEKIDNYEKEKRAYTSKLFNKARNNPSYFEQSIKDMQKWEEENENILEKIAYDINFIIKKFNLELKIDEATKSYEELTIKDLSNGNIIEYDNLSTGTKNFLSTFIPLKSYNPKDSIILIDEPENSFYPDIQRQLTKQYMSIGENNQLIMATHSPLIASSFEPWEVVELKFNEDNQIYREKYYEGENHVDNYTLDPRMLTWTGILTDIFDMKEDSNFTVREKYLMEYIRLENKIKNMSDKKEKMVEFEKLMKLSKRLGLSGNEKN
jgi:predicted ATPase